MRLLSVAIDSEESIVKEAVGVLKNCGMVVYPTDTIYGIGADACRSECVNLVYMLKHRDTKEPISAMVSDFKMLSEYAEVSGEQRTLLQQLLPGRVSVILDSAGKLAPNLAGDSVSFRIPLHPLCIKIIEEFGKPITTTSANISGKEVPAGIEGIIEQFGDKVDLYIDGGELFFDASTVIDLRGEPKILRKGMDLERVEGVLKRI